jgi:hypothetical protein
LWGTKVAQEFVIFSNVPANSKVALKREWICSRSLFSRLAGQAGSASSPAIVDQSSSAESLSVCIQIIACRENELTV